MCFNPRFLYKKNLGKNIVGFIPCGKCPECELSRINDWNFRIQHELKYYKQSCILTLTYNDEHLPENGELKKKDFQDFLKRLRFFCSGSGFSNIKYFGCGEYGKKYGRPHYHALVFGYCPPDLKFLKRTKNGVIVYTSPLLEKIWQNGFAHVSLDLTKNSIKYICKYFQKFNPNHDRQVKPFSLISRGVGLRSLDVSWLDNDLKTYFDGHFVKVPRYYKYHFEKLGYGVQLRKITFRSLDNLLERSERFLSSLCFSPETRMYFCPRIRLKRYEFEKKFLFSSKKIEFGLKRLDFFDIMHIINEEKNLRNPFSVTYDKIPILELPEKFVKKNKEYLQYGFFD